MNDPHKYQAVPDGDNGTGELLWIIVDEDGFTVEPTVGYSTKAQAVDRIQEMIIEDEDATYEADLPDYVWLGP